MSSVWLGARVALLWPLRGATAGQNVGERKGEGSSWYVFLPDYLAAYATRGVLLAFLCWRRDVNVLQIMPKIVSCQPSRMSLQIREKIQTPLFAQMRLVQLKMHSSRFFQVL